MNGKGRLDCNALRSHLGYRMRIVSNAVSHSFARKLETCGVTVAEWVVLREMYSGADTMSQSMIADMTGLTRGAVSKLISRLLHKKLITRAESAGDRRYQDIALTAKALKLVPKLARIADQNDAHFFSGLSLAEKKTLMNILVKLAGMHALNLHPTE